MCAGLTIVRFPTGYTEGGIFCVTLREGSSRLVNTFFVRIEGSSRLENKFFARIEVQHVNICWEQSYDISQLFDEVSYAAIETYSFNVGNSISQYYYRFSGTSL